MRFPIERRHARVFMRRVARGSPVPHPSSKHRFVMTAVPPSGMTSYRPYLLRALWEWIVDNGMTPHLLVDAQRPGVKVPPHTVKNGQVVLNIADRAVAHLRIGNEVIVFSARFGGVSHQVSVPVGAVLAIYARETGQGMALPEEGNVASPGGEREPTGAAIEGDGEPTAAAGKTAGPHLSLAAADPAVADAAAHADRTSAPESDDDDTPPPPRRGGHLRVVK